MRRLRHLACTAAATLVAATATSAVAVPAPGEPPVDGPAVARVAAAPGGNPVFASVLAISVDGLNPTAIRRLGRDGTPHLHALMRRGASTLNARTERELTLTLPNHTGMVTGRRITAASGGHGVTWNDDRPRPRTVQAAAGHPVDSIFSTLAGQDRSTALFASKSKFSLWQRSWPASLDRAEVPAVDEQEPAAATNAALVDDLLADLDTPRAFRFLHLSLPDAVGHDHGWLSPAYLKAVRRSDRLVGRVVDAVTTDPDLATSTAIILTSDHGGAGRLHGDATRLANYRVPFMVRGAGIPAGADLYDLNPDYRDPGTRRTSYAATRQPVRNGALANLALDLLGLGPVPGSEHNRAQDLDVS